jgi:ubiquinone/menaquinone biosynthesis C-methylase UbiE
MLLNSVEKFLMNNPVRSLLQWRHEAAMMERLGGKLTGLRVLEIGCGRGVGTEIILERFEAGEVHAFDLDPDMVRLARERLARYSSDRVRLFAGDAENIEAADDSFDAVVDFGIIHHCPNWQRAVAEVRRVLKPSGKFFFEEVTKQALDRWFYRTFLEHPTENHFTAAQFVAEVESQGITVGRNTIEWFFGDLIVGAGHRL